MIPVRERKPLERLAPLRVATLGLLSLMPGMPPASRGPGAEPVPVVIANDNRSSAGRLSGNVLKVDLVVRMARWYPESNDGPSIEVEAFAEEGQAPRIPAPLIRVPAGTVIEATIRNALPESTITIVGLQARSDAIADSVRITAGATRTLRFAVGGAGTYVYRAVIGQSAQSVRRMVEREQAAGAFVVDSAGARPRDRVFVINIWGERKDSLRYRNALAINGKSWPHTERIAATTGDSLRWRVVNASARTHPMHLHGFYFRVDARGDGARDTIFAPAQQRLAVTEALAPGHTMAVTWSPTRPGNWLFHCHLAFHVVPGARLDPPPAGDNHVHSAERHMAGLVLGIAVNRDRKWIAPREGKPRRLRLFVQEGRKRGHAPRTFAYVLQGDTSEPAPDSARVPGSTLILTRDEPTHITVINRLNEATGVHWHGIELESYSDGVVGWSGEGKHIAPAIAPRDSFTARLTLPRSGTFIYHTHLNDIEQLTSGLYGAIVVLEPGARFDPGTDHLFVAGRDGRTEPPRLLVNGDSQSPPLAMAFGERHRIRLVNIGPAGVTRFALLRDSAVVRWRFLAKDGADLPSAQSLERPARAELFVGETADFEFVPAERGHYILAVERLEGGWRWRQQIDVK